MTRNSISEGLTITFIEKIAGQAVGFVISLILARLLDPSYYGIVAIVNVSINIADVFITSGLGNSLIQRKDIDRVDYSTMLISSLALSAFLCIILFFISPSIALYYEMPALVQLIRLMSLKLPFAAIISVEQAYISRNMLFHIQMIASLISSLFGAIVGISMAYSGCGVYSLVIQSIVTTVINALILTFAIRKIPGWEFSFVKFWLLFSFGWKLLVTALIDRVYNEARSLIIGKMFSSEDLAFYNKGQDLPSMVMTSIDSSMTRVFFPALSQKQDKDSEFTSMVSKSVSLSTYLIMPALVGFAFVADKLVLIVLTEKWMPCVPYLIIFCIYYMFTPIKSAKYQAIKAIGRSDVSLKCEVIQKIFGVLILLYTVLGLRSVMAIAVGNIVFTLVTVIITAVATRKYVRISYRQQVKDIIPAGCMCIIMSVFLWGVTALKLGAIWELCLQIVVGVMAYIVFSHIFGFEQYTMMVDIIRKMITKTVKRR